MHEAKTHRSRLVERVSEGEEIVIGRNGRPVARSRVSSPTSHTPRRVVSDG